MKKPVALFILSFYIISSTELREIIKLPVLFQHFYEHQVLDNEITFLTYLSDHYNTVPHTDNDEDRDRQLPFKTLDMSALSMTAIPVFYGDYLQKAVCTLPLNRPGLYKENFVPGPSCGKVWQPPKA